MNCFKYISVFVTSILIAQSDINPTAALKNLSPPNAPAFVLMDIAPSNIIVPDNIQAFSIQTINAFSGNSTDGLGNTNFALEFQPYWYVKREKMNFFTYNNLKLDQPEKETISVNDYTHYNIFGDAWKKASISLALMNGTYNVFEVPQSYVSIGARTRLLSVKTQNQISEIKAQYARYEQLMSSPEVMMVFAKPGLSLEEKNTTITSLDGYQAMVADLEESLQLRPLFALDVAVAYSHFMGDKSQNLDATFGRFGVWATGDLAFYMPTMGKHGHVHIYGVLRYLRDGLHRDLDSGALRIEDAIDYGAKIALEFDNLYFGYEYITRDADKNTEERSMGSIRYKITEAFTINGGFGKNFISEGQTVALLGIQWGLDFNSSVSLDPNK